jgi:ABC-type branched-subunit amino acid transport system ATPase component/ABC-type branched-subunit amino acid transport system permease subunit
VDHRAPARSTRFWISVAAGAALLVALPMVLSSFQLFFATTVLCYVLIAAGLNIVLGYSGQLSVAHAGLVGIGAYTTAVMLAVWDAPILLCLATSALVATVFGIVVGIPALRIRGHYLALATLAFQMIVQTILWNWVDVTGGPNGKPVPFTHLFGMDLGDTEMYWFVATIVLMMLVMTRNLARSRFGRALVAVREQDIMAEVMGVNLARYKTQAFAASAFYAGLGGGLFAIAVGHLDPAAFMLWQTVAFIVMVLLGGAGTVAGPILGGVLVGGAPEFFRAFEEFWPIFYFVTIILILMFLPAGMVGGLQKLARRFLPAQWVRSKFEVGVREQAEKDRTGEAGVEAPAAIHVIEESPEPATAQKERAEPLIEVHDVSLRFGGLQALHRVNLDVRRGEVAGLIGPNGAGKTTLFNVMTRVLVPNVGRIVFDGQDLASYRTHQIVGLGLSRTFQNVAVAPSLSVAENVILGMHNGLDSGLFRSAMRTRRTRTEEREASLRARALLDQLNLGPYADNRVTELPLGLQRRIELARALAANPKLVLLDEPASGLSQEEAGELIADIRSLQRYGITVLVIEHNVRFVMGLCSHVSVLDKGKIIYHGSAAGAQRDERVIEAYLGKEEYNHVGG